MEKIANFGAVVMAITIPETIDHQPRRENGYFFEL
jgi:hypothetical protein